MTIYIYIKALSFCLAIDRILNEEEEDTANDPALNARLEQQLMRNAIITYVDAFELPGNYTACAFFSGLIFETLHIYIINSPFILLILRIEQRYYSVITRTFSSRQYMERRVQSNRKLPKLCFI